nr:protein MCM10 homolog [Leptinotarsa decemlineata]
MAVVEEDESMLDALLSAASDELEYSGKNGRSLKDTDLFQSEDSVPQVAEDPIKSVVRSGDTDSSEDESNRNWESSKYNQCGKVVKDILGTSPVAGSSTKQRLSLWKKKSALSQPVQPPSKVKAQTLEKQDVYSDPIFGMRIINPMISSAVLQERMLGREAVFLSRISYHLQFKKQDSDWVIAGVIVNKSTIKTSQKGNQYSIWTLSDLREDIKTVAVFLFSSAHSQLWKTSVGTVVGLLNPNVLDKRDGSKDEASLSIDNPQKVMIMGQSKDFGTCKSIKKNGEKCTAIVNKNRCEFCVFHIKQEYQKCSKRSELQANFSGRGLMALRNKVLGKNEVFYAGKSYMAIPSKKSAKLELKDTNRLQSLNSRFDGTNTNSNNVFKAKTNSTTKKKQSAARLDVSQAQRMRDIELLKKLGGSNNLETKNNFSGTRSSDITLEESKSIALSVINKLKAKKQTDGVSQADKTEVTDDKISPSESQIAVEKQNGNLVDYVQLEVSQKENSSKSVDLKVNPKAEEKSTPKKMNSKSETGTNLSAKERPPFFQSPSANGLGFPKLSSPGSGSFIDLNKPVTPRHADRAKLNAIRLIQEKGPLKKANPNNLKGSGKKRFLEENLEVNSPAKKSKLAESDLISQRFKKMMAATSSHMDLLEARDEEEKEKYFDKLEAKERMEEKMTSTFKIACKAVRCLVCKYTSFSAADQCKSERHPLKVFDALKRFFKCGHCGNRIVCLEVIPTEACKNCGSGKWERTGMMKEKVVTAAHSLSIRGGEQKFMNSVTTDANINLLVPDSS